MKYFYPASIELRPDRAGKVIYLGYNYLLPAFCYFCAGVSLWVKPGVSIVYIILGIVPMIWRVEVWTNKH